MGFEKLYNQLLKRGYADINQVQATYAKIKIRKHSSKRNSLKGCKCVRCGVRKHLTRHHEEYDQPRDFIVLCRECHDVVEFLTEKKLEEDYNDIKYDLMI